ncbi:MAG: phosphoribosylglycinamide formyltransferase [Chloroflexota bacterium]
MSGRLVVLASGGGSNLQALIDEIAAGALDVQITLVIVNRKAALAGERAARAGIPYRYEPLRPWLERGLDRDDYDAHLAQIIAADRPDILIMAGWMHICSDAFVAQFPNQIMNVHPALLPSFPGAHAIRDALAYGVKVTGVTVMYVWPGGLTAFDNGPIILQAAVPVEDNDTEETLGARLHTVEHRLLPEAVRLHLAGRLRVVERRVQQQD